MTARILMNEWSLCSKTLVAYAALLLLAFINSPTTVNAANFACGSGDVACLIAAMKTANANGQANTITLAAGNYVLAVIDNNTDGPNGLPSITGPLTIDGLSDELTNIVRDPGAPDFRLIHIAKAGSLTLRKVTLHAGDVIYGGDGV